MGDYCQRGRPSTPEKPSLAFATRAVADAQACFITIQHVEAREALMDDTPLRVFASKAQASNRLLYGDLRRLQRDVLPTGAQSHQ